MNKWLRIFLAAILTPIGASAELLVPTFSGIRPLFNKGARVAPVVYRTEKGPGSRANPVPHLREEQLKQLSTRLDALIKKEEAANGGETTITRKQMMTLLGRMQQIDRIYVDPIPPEKWDAIVGKMGDAAEEAFDPAKGNWDDTVVKMLKTAVGELKDIHSNFMDQDDLADFLREGRQDYVGGGFEISKTEKEKGGFAKAGLIFPGSPAERAGLKEDDVIEFVQEPGGERVPTADRDLGEVVKRILGKENTKVLLYVRREGIRPLIKLTLTRGRIEHKAVYSRMQTADIGYVYFANFVQKNIDSTVIRHVAALLDQGASKIILDVRGNPGGNVTVVSEIASEFLAGDDVIVSFKRQGRVVTRNVTDGDGVFADVPVVILINGGSASASEILASALQDHSAAPTVVGSRSYGKGTAQTITPGPLGALHLTIERWFSPADRTIDAEHDANGYPKKDTGGVVPDVTVETTPKQERAIHNAIVRDMYGASVTDRPADPALQKAVEILGRRSAS